MELASPVFDVELEGSGLEAATGRGREKGRVVGGLIGGTMVELLALDNVPAGQQGPHLGYPNMSLRVDDLDGTYEQLRRFRGVHVEPPIDVGGVRMLFLYDPMPSLSSWSSCRARRRRPTSSGDRRTANPLSRYVR
jgi:hypothetical protein